MPNKEELLFSICSQLEEHFDTVRIICTVNSPDISKIATVGGGNLYGQIGSVRAWLIEQDEDTKEFIRQNYNE